MNLPRRTAIKLVSVGAVTVFSGKLNFALPSLAVPTRRSLTGMALDDPDLSAYRDFVGLMLAADQSKPVSWLGFSSQHGSKSAFKYCPHGDWYFLPWHRAYVLMYEQAVRQLTAKPDFAMPYWNWTEIRTIPDAFANPMYKGKPNPLYVANRNTINLSDDVVGQEKVIDAIYDETLFEAFGTTRNPKQNNLDPVWVVRGGGSQGILERTPHNSIHNLIGGYMPQSNSPRDPVFFMHHCNIDRIWYNWNSLGRKNSTDALWLNMTFKDNFIDPDGSLYSATVKDLQDIVTLGYQYDVKSLPDDRSSDPAREGRLLSVLQSPTGKTIAGVQRFGGRNATLATSSKPLSQALTLTEASLNAITTNGVGKNDEVYALINNIKLGANVRGLRVFVNHPDLSIDTPNTDPHFVSTIAFLDHSGHGDNDEKQLPSAIVRLTSTLKRLHGLERLKIGEISVQLIPIPVPGVILDTVEGVAPGSVEIVIL